MRLKTLTSVLMATGFLLLVGWPWIVGARPQGRAELRDYVIRAGVYFAVLLVISFSTVVCAWLVVRQQREEFRRQSRENLRELIEGTLKDHENKTS